MLFPTRLAMGTVVLGCLAFLSSSSSAAEFPPRLPDGQEQVVVTGQELLAPPATLRPGVEIARQPPRVRVFYYPGQTYEGNPWSVWGDGLFANGKYYSAIGDHRAPGGNAFVYEFDPQTQQLRKLLDIRSLLQKPNGHYTPGKVHTKLSLGRDGWLYFGTHRGSTRTTTDEFHYQGDWLLRHHPGKGTTEVVAAAPAGKCCIPTGQLDPERLIFYGGTAAADYRDKTVKFFAFDVAAGKVRHEMPGGPKRAMILSERTGRVYWMNEAENQLMRYDPAVDQPPRAIAGQLGLRAATRETPEGFVYTVGQGEDPYIWRFNTKTEEITKLGPAAVGGETYITSLDCDSTGQYLFYCPGAHGGSWRDGTPIVRFDTKTAQREVVAFLTPALGKHTGFTPIGTYSLAVDDSGQQIFVTWNGCRNGPDTRGRYPFEVCALTMIELPQNDANNAPDRTEQTSAQASNDGIRFDDVSQASNVQAALAGMYAHGAAWGDADGDGRADLYVGTFHKPGGKPNELLLQADNGSFQSAVQPAVQVSGRANTPLFVDLDNDGDLDLYLSNLGGGQGHQGTTNKLFRNDGQGRFTDSSRESGACPAEFRGRGATAADLNGDGLLDLILGEGIYYGSDRRSRVMMNQGQLRFTDRTADVGLPGELPGLAVAAADMNADTWPDLFFTGRDGGNRLFLNDGTGHFREAPGSRETFAWQFPNGDDSTAGVAIADLNRDGLPDVVIGHHFDHPWREPEPVRLYLHRGIKDGVPQFADVTAQAGLPKLPMKAPHVEIQDFNNDGWPDIVLSILKFDDQQRPHPIVLINHGSGDSEGPVPQFTAPALAVNDFPTTEDQRLQRNSTFFEKMLAERKIIYTAAAPTADFDRDGRIDVFFSSWWPEQPARLLRNVTTAAEQPHWLQVQFAAKNGVNRQAIGALVNIYPAGKLGQQQHRLAARELGIGAGYASGQEAVLHFGLGSVSRVDVEVILPHNAGRWTHEDVAVDRRVLLSEDKVITSAAP